MVRTERAIMTPRFSRSPLSNSSDPSGLNIGKVSTKIHCTPGPAGCNTIPEMPQTTAPPQKLTTTQEADSTGNDDEPSHKNEDQDVEDTVGKMRTIKEQTTRGKH